jgi:hypothetical protein
MQINKANQSIIPDVALELRNETPNGKKYAFGGTSQRLIPEMRSSATDTGDKAFASADSDLQPSCPVQLCCRGWSCNRFSNAIFHLTNYKTLTVNNFLSSIFWEVRNF